MFDYHDETVELTNIFVVIIKLKFLPISRMVLSCLYRLNELIHRVMRQIDCCQRFQPNSKSGG